jgi:hypothetical protein
MADIRDKVEDDRGLLKKIQLHIPGFAGYRRREDIRAADNILRIQMADRLNDIREGLEESRRVMVENMETTYLEKLGGVVNKIRSVEGQVRHAEQGYSGISATIRIEEEELDRLYEYDFALINHVLAIESCIVALRRAVNARDANAMNMEIENIRSRLEDFERTFEERIPRIAGIYNI